MALEKPPIEIPITNSETGGLTPRWQGWFLRLFNRVGGVTGTAAPLDATYIVQTANSDLTGEQALSTLSSGFMKVTTGSGVITSTGNTTIQTADIGDNQVTTAKMATTGVVNDIYGSASKTVTYTVGVDGRLTDSTEQSISITGSQINDATISAGASVSGSNTGDQINISGNAATVTTNANLTGPVTSIGNATTISAGVVTEAMQVLADNTTNDVSTTKHGYAPKGDGSTTKFLNANGAYSTPAGGGDALTSNPLSQFASTTSAQLAGVLSDEVGSGIAFFGSDWTDYTATVTLVGGAGNTVPVYSSSESKWMRVGNIVFVDLSLTGDGGAEGAGTGTVNIALPVASAAYTNDVFGVMAGHAINGSTYYHLIAYVPQSASTVRLRYLSSLTAIYTALTGDNQNNTTRSINMRFWYRV